jgi:hypothetical protein
MSLAKSFGVEGHGSPPLVCARDEAWLGIAPCDCSHARERVAKWISREPLERKPSAAPTATSSTICDRFQRALDARPE